MSLQHDSLRIIEFIELLEADYQLKFYYNPAWIEDSSSSNVNYNNVELLSGIKDYFMQFGFGVYEDLPVIYITRGDIPKKGFARDFHKSLPNGTPIPLEVTYAIKEENEKERFNGSLIEMVQFGNPSPNVSENKFYIKGIVLDAVTGQGIIGATIQIAGTLQKRYALIRRGAGRFHIGYKLQDRRL
jgi:hypothetical protein